MCSRWNLSVCIICGVREQLLCLPLGSVEFGLVVDGPVIGSTMRKSAPESRFEAAAAAADIDGLVELVVEPVAALEPPRPLAMADVDVADAR